MGYPTSSIPPQVTTCIQDYEWLSERPQLDNPLLLTIQKSHGKERENGKRRKFWNMTSLSLKVVSMVGFLPAKHSAIGKTSSQF